MPTMAYTITSLGYISSYAKVYAIFNICYSIGMIFGPLSAGLFIETFRHLVPEYPLLPGMLVIASMIVLFLPFYVLFTLKIERKRARLPHTWSQVFSTLCQDLWCPPDAALPKTAPLLEIFPEEGAKVALEEGM